jgi:hypothetical protein
MHIFSSAWVRRHASRGTSLISKNGLQRSRLSRSFSDGGTVVSAILCSSAFADAPLSSSQVFPRRSGFQETSAAPRSKQKLKGLREKRGVAVLDATN